jgi:hypothetical protein
MNWIKKTLIFTMLSIAFLLVFKADSKNIEKTNQENARSFYSNNNLHSSVFIQPHFTHSFIVHGKSNQPTVTKWFTLFSYNTPNLKTQQSFHLFLRQDINRCVIVSLLIFPFHFFW